MKNQVSRLVESNEFKNHPDFPKMWDNATKNGIHWMPGRKKYYIIREVNGTRYFVFDDCLMLAWRFCNLYSIPLELEGRMRAIMKWEDNYMAIAMATKSSDPLEVAILKLYAEDMAYNDAVRYGSSPVCAYTDGKNVCVVTMDGCFAEGSEIMPLRKYKGEAEPLPLGSYTVIEGGCGIEYTVHKGNFLDCINYKRYMDAGNNDKYTYEIKEK